MKSEVVIVIVVAVARLVFGCAAKTQLILSSAIAYVMYTSTRRQRTTTPGTSKCSTHMLMVCHNFLGGRLHPLPLCCRIVALHKSEMLVKYIVVCHWWDGCFSGGVSYADRTHVNLSPLETHEYTWILLMSPVYWWAFECVHLCLWRRHSYVSVGIIERNSVNVGIEIPRKAPILNNIKQFVKKSTGYV